MVNNLHNLLPLLRPFGALYGSLMRIRAFLYKTGIFKRYRFRVPIISVGNLTMGGSGKTPIVIYLADLLQQQGFKPAVVSRGYGGRAADKINVVSDGTTLYLDSIQAGDEPRLIAETVRNAVVLTGKKRKDPCRFAVDKLGCNVIILDDGFQHMSVARDIDLVVFNAVSHFNSMRVLPGGILREPFSALNRADGFVISGYSENADSQTGTLTSFLQHGWHDIPLFRLRYTPSHYVDCHGNNLPINYFGSPVFAFCGIASPHRFKNTLEAISLNLVAFEGFSDHQQYTQESLNRIINRAKRYGAHALLTTEKDLVKLKTFETDLPLYALGMKVESSPSFDEFIREKLAQNS